MRGEPWGPYVILSFIRLQANFAVELKLNNYLTDSGASHIKQDSLEGTTLNRFQAPC